MKKIKLEKGITLVALIIIIIVLLILAVVAIGAVNNTGIIQHAKNSADEYTDGRDEENTTLGNYLDIINHHYETIKGGNSGETELYGSKLYGIEFVTQTAGKYYVPDINENGYLDVTFSNNKIFCDGENLGEYTIHTLENNKIIIIGSDEVLTTNGTVGLNNSLLDGKKYTGSGESIEFNEGKVSYKGLSDYYIWDSNILEYDSELGILGIFATELSEDLTTFVHKGGGSTYTLQQ